MNMRMPEASLPRSADEDLNPSALAVFRYGSLLVCIALGVQLLVQLHLFGPPALPYQHFPLLSLVMWIAGGGAAVAANRLDGIFKLVVVLYVLAPAVFAMAFWVRTDPLRKAPALIDAGLLGGQILLGLLINPELLYIVAAELALMLALRPASAWLGIQAATYIAWHLPRLIHGPGTFLICNVRSADITPLPVDQQMVVSGLNIVMGLVFQAAAFGIGYLAATERRRRIDIAATHAELLATRQLLGDAVRTAERVRIARDLHDAIGHHLTAIHLHLDLAKRQSGTPVAEPLEAAYALAQQLLAEVRRVVSTERTRKN
jgi:signal transduction histidine kinase